MSADLFTEASEIVTAIATMDPRDVGLDCCWFCQGWPTDDDSKPDDVFAYDHEPDCPWIRARRLCRLEIHPHKVAK